MMRARHHKIVTRIIAHDMVGTKSAPLDSLVRLTEHKFCLKLWQARTQLARSGPVEALS
jgi:hypothetical protein